MELFLEGQTKWEEDSSHQQVMLYEMFKHATDEGQKEAEQMVHQGFWQGLPKLDPEADISAIQLIGPQTTKLRDPIPIPQGLQTTEATRIPTWGIRANRGGGVFL